MVWQGRGGTPLLRSRLSSPGSKVFHSHSGPTLTQPLTSQTLTGISVSPTCVVATERKQAWLGQVLQLTSRMGIEVRQAPTASLHTVGPERLGRPGLRTQRQPRKKVWATGYARQVHGRHFRVRGGFMRGTCASCHQTNKASLVLWAGLSGRSVFSNWGVRPRAGPKDKISGQNPNSLRPESQRPRLHPDRVSILNGQV